MWALLHIGKTGNEKADEAAKSATEEYLEEIKILLEDLKADIKNTFTQKWKSIRN